MGFHLVEAVKVASKEELDKVAKEIRSEMKAACNRPAHPWKTGLAEAAVSIHVTGEHSRFVGSMGGEGAKHMYYLNEGNGGSGRIITAGGKAMGKYPGGIPGIGWRRSVHGYNGIHFIEKIAARHGG